MVFSPLTKRRPIVAKRELQDVALIQAAKRSFEGSKAVSAAKGAAKCSIPKPASLEEKSPSFFEKKCELIMDERVRAFLNKPFHAYARVSNGKRR